MQRTKASGSKAARFLEMQKYIASKQITFAQHAKHYDMCKKHMSKITANDTHANDDICDTAYDAVKMGLIDKSIYYNPASAEDSEMSEFLSGMDKDYADMRDEAWY